MYRYCLQISPGYPGLTFTLNVYSEIGFSQNVWEIFTKLDRLKGHAEKESRDSLTGEKRVVMMGMRGTSLSDPKIFSVI